MITLTLLHPIQSTPVQSWTFEHEPVIRIGRSTDNHVILYSAVVSRHHVELRQVDSVWEIVNLGANGTYLDGQQIAQVPVVDGVIIRLARSGPNIQIHLGSSSTHNLAKEKALIQRVRSKPEPSKVEKPAISPSNLIPPTDIDSSTPKAKSAKNQLQYGTVSEALPSQVGAIPVSTSDKSPLDGDKQLSCLHPRATPDMAFCPDCGQPLHTGQAIGEYQVVKTLSRDRIGVTQLVWSGGHSLLLKTLNLEYVSHPEVLQLFEQQAKALLKLSHPNIPNFVDFFEIDGHPYLVMEPVHGQDLRQRVTAQGPLTQQQAIALILQVCDVLDYLHHQSPIFVHHDLRPENLICRNAVPAGETTIVVTGFLSLNTLKMDTQSTTVGYLAPEQQQGHGSLASDLFALGPILIYLLTGQEPNQFYAHREQGFRLYPEYVPGLVPDLAVVIRRLTNPDPEERYANAKEVAQALSQVYEMLPEKL